jgi:hypothetical protein
MGWNSDSQRALKILGDGAKVPDLPGGVTKANEGWDKAYEAFVSSRDGTLEKLLDMDNANSAAMNAVQQFRAKRKKRTSN